MMMAYRIQSRHSCSSDVLWRPVFATTKFPPGVGSHKKQSLDVFSEFNLMADFIKVF